MNIKHLQEPLLEFGAGRHIDIRFGLMNYGPLDFESSLAPKQIKVGIVGTPQTVEGLQGWFEECRNGIEAKPSNKPNLFPRFPGFEEGFRSSLLLDSQLVKTIHPNILEQLAKKTRGDALVGEAATIFLSEIRYLVENANPDVLIAALPMSLLEAMDISGDGESESGDEDATPKSKLNFHHLLKANGMDLRKPIQIILPMTYDKGARRNQKSRPWKLKQLQDEATRAWNLHTALYYKAGGIPWRLVRDPTQLTACFVGVSFYKTLDFSSLMTSVAQVFNQRGEGVIVRGGAAKISKEDRQAHLSSEDSKLLLNNALECYRKVHGNFPARLVLHKSSPFNYDELEGFRAAIAANRIDHYDLVSVGDSYIRLFRNGEYPPLRGTLLELDSRIHVLYTRGSIPFFETYTSKYPPVPFLFRCEDTTETPKKLAEEMLALTKMNWNNTQFDGRQPITVRAAKQVGSILKYIDENGFVEPRYSCYM
jgi:hypothetical protein